MASTRRSTRKQSVYDLHPGFKMEESSLANLKERTGETLEQWVRFVKKSGPSTEKERREWLRTEHGLTTHYASWVAERMEGKGAAEDYDPEAYVDALYAGAKAALRPIHERLVQLGKQLGKDVKISPCQTIVPFYRKHVFAQIKPTTKTRIDFGFALKDTPAKGRLIDTGGFAKKDRITHRIPIAKLAEIDDEVLRWLDTAYAMDA